MEALFIYLIKSSGLIGLFYVAYFFMLRKETFFNSNRWFLLAGLFTSVILPLVFITKIVWIEPAPTDIDWSNVPMNTYAEEKSFEDYLPMITAAAYGIGLLLLLAKFAFDFYSLNSVLKGKTIQHQADFKFVDVRENLAPFSYFNTIVYNSTLYNASELENILEHEKVHSEQNHTADVLISRLFCVVFWFNPFIWLYKKAILQNLEFIADSEASKKISDKKAYQITLLKITTQENCVAITNHFYQSLIKKRIVMLNKNQSKKRNLWKYAFVLPVLVAFVFLFQIKVIAKERESQTVSKTVLDVVTTISKNFSDEDLKKKAEFFKKEFNCDLVFSEIERNSKNEIIGITVNYSGSEYGNGTYKQHSSNAIKDIYIKHDGSGKINITDAEIDARIKNNDAKIALSEAQELAVEKEIFINGEKVSQNDLDKLDPNEITTINVNKNDDKQEIRIITNKYAKMANENDIYINGQKVSQNELDVLDQNTIERMDVNNNEKTIRIVTRNGIQHPQDRNLPVPPTPPTPPVLNIKTPAPPAFPKAPKAPKGDPVNGDKKAWKEFEKKMEDYEAKMKKLEPQMEAFDKEMEEFDKKMEPFNKEMEAFEKKMKVYEQQMEEYHSNLEHERKK
ncbi:M56 family metallopeptidase [Flavobacterium maritimum]|uniref:M56 family metallopeptidase n=1 Tax=Flavobacterium maritimum TaxID=3149042 RepID=UPI0032B4E821